MCEPRKIPNHELTLADIPGPHAEWEEVEPFALTFNGYQFDNCAEIANSRRNDTLTNMRTCLFYEQRRARHCDEIPEGEEMDYIHELIEKIRRCVVSGNI